jgi:transcriptional regulator with PAS, ATPase and Fis domain
MNIQSLKQRFGIVGRSEKLDRGLSTAARVANTDLTVLITGESGVGKDIFFRIIHELSKRKHNKFIGINCGAIPEGTINSELFGHEKGAFTGASTERKGYFETGSGGTIFLDEIGEMPLDTQAYLLRVLESGEFLRVGSSKVLRSDVRIIAATNVNLEDKIQKGKFREDLYYRLNTVPIHIPSLQERREDIPILFRKFAVDIAEQYKMDPVQLTEEARALIVNYRWRGNIRELKNLVEQISVLSDKKIMTAELLLDYAPKLLQRNLPSQVSSAGEKSSIEEREILYKFLFEMKNDLNDLKSLVYEMMRTNNLDFPSLAKSSSEDIIFPSELSRYDNRKSYNKDYHTDEDSHDSKPVILAPDDDRYAQTEVLEESLSLDEKTKELIIKALEKHKGKRKDAAEDLGISERTLYRKIKEYEIAEIR